MNTFCTIITSDHLPFAEALHASLVSFDADMRTQVLVTDLNTPAKLKDVPPGMQLYYLQDIRHYGLSEVLFRTYGHTSRDHLRWSLKPVFISFLLDNGFSKVLYTDWDTFYFATPSFLFAELDTCSLLLTPHWISADPVVSKEHFFTLFTHGIFNGGFIGATRKGIAALQWWAGACLFRMGAVKEEGIYDDQRYLDLLPVLCEDLRIVRHKGCNIAEWNKQECRRIAWANNEVLINGIFPVIFIHFTAGLIEDIRRGHDKLLESYLQKYAKALQTAGTSLAARMQLQENGTIGKAFLRIKWRLRLRTRLKGLLFRLAERL